MSDAVPDRKTTIVYAATEVFAEKGYDAGSMREIAARVGVSEPALYRHFSGKEELFLAIMRGAGGLVRDETLALVGTIEAEGLRDQMIEVLRNRRRAVQHFGPLLRMILPAVARNPRFLEEWRTLIVFPVRAGLTEKAAELDDALDVPNADATRDGRVRSLMSLMIGYMMSSFVIGDDPDDVVVDAALRVMGWER